MSRCLLLLSPIALFIYGLSAADPKLDAGFVRLDNGKDLMGWTGMTEGWSVVDGAIHLDAKKAKEHIYHEKTHGANLLVQLEFKASEGGDSGVYIHGKQFQVRDYPKVGPKDYAAHAKPAGEWNRLELDFTDGIAVVKLNGQIIEKAWKIGIDAKKGIGLNRDKGDFDFRNIAIKEKELPKKEVKKEEEPKKKKK